MVRLLSCDQFESFVENQTKSSLFSSSSSSSKSIIKCLKLNDHPPPPPPHHHSHFQIDQTSEMYHRMPLSIDIIGSPSSSTSIAETVLRNVPTPNDSTDLIDQLKIPLETDLKPEPIVIDSLNLKESVENNTETIVPNSTIELYINNNNNNNNQSSTTTSPVIQRPTSLYEPYRTNSKSNCTTPNQDIPYNLLGNQMGATTAAAAAATAAVSVTPNLNHPIFHGSAVNMVMTPPSPYSTITSIVSEVPNPATLYSLSNGSNCGGGGGGGGNVLTNMNNAAGGASITSSSTTTTSSTTPGSTESTFTDLAPNPWFNGSIQRTGNLYSDFIGSEWTNSITGNGPYQPFSGNPYSGSISSVYHSHATSVRPPPPPPPPPPTGNPINDHFYNSYHAHAYFQPTPLFTNAMAAATATGSASSPNGPQSSSTPSSVDVQAAYQFNPITIGTEFASIRSFGCNLLNSSPDSGLTVSSEGPESPKDQFLYSHTHSHHHHHHHPLHPSHFHPSFQWKQQQYQQQQQQQQQHQQQQQQQQQQHQYHQNQQQQQTQMLNVHLARPTSLPLINSIRNQIHSTSSTPEMDDDDDDDTKPNLDQLINGGNGQTQMQTPNGQAGGQQSQTTGGSQQQQQQQGSESNVTNGGNGGNMAMYNWMKKSTNSNLSQSSTGKTRTKDKYRVVYTETQRVELEKEFHFSRYITIKRKSELAGQLMLSERQVKIWFQNRRAKDRKQQRKRDEMFKKESKKESTIVPNGNNVIVANVGANLSGLGSAIPVASSTASVSSKSSSSSSTSSSSACCMPPNGLIESYQQQQQIQHVQQQQQHHQTPHSQTHTCLGLW